MTYVPATPASLAADLDFGFDADAIVPVLNNIVTNWLRAEGGIDIYLDIDDDTIVAVLADTVEYRMPLDEFFADANMGDGFGVFLHHGLRVYRDRYGCAPSGIDD